MDELVGEESEETVLPEKEIVESKPKVLNTKNDTIRRWLVKVPTYLIEHWDTLPQGSELGSVIITSTQNGEVKVKTSLTNIPENFPKEYEMINSTPKVSTKLLSENDDDDFNIEGTVQYIFKMKSEDSILYRDTIRKHADSQTIKSKRQPTKVIQKQNENIAQLRRKKFNWHEKKFRWRARNRKR